MVVCRYFLHGSCRFGQYCRFEHSNYGGNNQGERNKSYGEGKSVVLGVAAEILTSERGGQWLLSCFGPFKEESCIPGMEDVSPEEVRWEMYQAQKNGTVDETKLQFQQLCQAMTAKRDALKNPSQETAAMLEKLQKGNKNSAFGAKSNFALTTSQLPNNNSGTNEFVAKSFSSPNGPFGGGFPASAATTSSVFDHSNTNSTSVFGSKPSFGSYAVFGNQPTTNTVFGGTTSAATSVFGGGQQNMQTFGSAAQSPTTFLGISPKPQSIFGQSAAFGVSTQQNNIFPTTQSTTSVFSDAGTSSNSSFAGPITTQSNSSLFGGSTQGVTTLFGGATTIQPSTSIFSSSAAAPVSSSIGSTSIFGQSKTTAAFGGAPIFGSSANFGATAPTSNFIASSALNSPTNIFGTPTTATTFGSNGQTVNSFGALVTPAQNVFTTSQNFTPTFGNVSSNVEPPSLPTTFGAQPVTTATTMAFGNVPFGTPVVAATPFSRGTTFGSTLPGHSAISTSGAPVTNQPAFPSTIATTDFPNVSPGILIASTTTTTSVNNPFAPKSQQQITTPFTGTPSGTKFGGMSVGPFGKSASVLSGVTTIDNSVYSADIDLTDEEKNMYMSNQFIFGKIPLKPPTIELR